MDDLQVEKVLRAVESIPAGRVATYGMIAEVVGMTPRAVGRVMSLWGSTVAWWRVTNASGRLPEALIPRAVPQWIAEGTPRTADGTAVALSAARADADHLARCWHAACADLTAETSPASAPENTATTAESTAGRQPHRE